MSLLTAALRVFRNVLTDGWASGNGIMSAVWFASPSRPADYGLVAMEDLAEGSEVMSIPFDMVLTPEASPLTLTLSLLLWSRAKLSAVLRRWRCTTPK